MSKPSRRIKFGGKRNQKEEPVCKEQRKKLPTAAIAQATAVHETTIRSRAARCRPSSVRPTPPSELLEFLQMRQHPKMLPARAALLLPARAAAPLPLLCVTCLFAPSHHEDVREERE
jgi:hypothetical protein